MRAAPKHRDERYNEYCARELDYTRGDDVLQLGRVDLAGARRYLQREVPAGSMPALLAASAYWRCSASCCRWYTGWTIPARSATLRRGRTADDNDRRRDRRFPLVNLCGALGCAWPMFALYRRDPRSPADPASAAAARRGRLAVSSFRRRRLVDGKYFSRSVVADPASLIPLGALVVTEGILRRHAPRAAKIAALAGVVLIGFGGAIGLESYTKPYAIILALFQLAGFAICAWLLAMRDRDTLMASENRSIGRLAAGAIW
jgi:hypothetical protein